MTGAELEEILEKHRLWLKNQGMEGEPAALSAVDLSWSDLAGATLPKANLRGATLRGANLRGANLGGANLGYANLDHVNFSDADLSGADLRSASLNGALLFDADLSGADLRSASLNGADLSGANLTDVIIGSTYFGRTSLGSCKGLETIEVEYLCSIDFHTLRASKGIPKSFLLKTGLPELYIDYLPDFYQDEGIRFYPVFLSHSWENKNFARKLYEALIAKGINVFFDEKKMKPGDDIFKSISRGIDHYDKMILVCSKESLKSWWVDREVDRILKKERNLYKEEAEHIDLLIPITIDDFVYKWDGPKAEEIQRYVIGDFRNWQDEAAFEKALGNLIHALNVDRPEIKPPSYIKKKKSE